MPNVRLTALAVFMAVASLSSAQMMGEKVAMTAEEVKPIAVGTPMPDPTVRRADGSPVPLSEALGGKPTVLVFFRGGWCPYCNVHLKDLARVEGDLKAMGYQIVALTPDSPDKLPGTAEKDGVGYTLLSDSKVEAAQAFGVAFRVDDETFTMYKDQYKLDLEAWSGETHHVLPVPAVFIVDGDGTVRYAHSNPDYRKRLSGAEVLAAAKSAKG